MGLLKSYGTNTSQYLRLLIAHLNQIKLPTFDQNSFAGDLVIRGSVRALD